MQGVQRLQPRSQGRASDSDEDLSGGAPNHVSHILPAPQVANLQKALAESDTKLSRKAQELEKTKIQASPCQPTLIPKCVANHAGCIKYTAALRNLAGIGLVIITSSHALHDPPAQNRKACCNMHSRH